MHLDYVGFLVCGSRTVGNYDKNIYNSDPFCSYTNKEHVDLFCDWMGRLTSRIVETHKKHNSLFTKNNILIIHGQAVGPDDMAAIWARKNQFNVLAMPAQWDLFGKSAGYRRNVEMINICDYVFAAYDGHSKGTAHTIKLAKERKKKIKTLIFD